MIEQRILRAKKGRLSWRLGQVAQGLCMGVLLVFGVIGLAALFGGVSAFQYQGY